MVNNFTYNANIPASGNNPSMDQPIMQENAQSISSLIAIDHVGFSTNNGGYHHKVTLNDVTDPSTVAITNPESLIYSANGTADTNSQLFFKNQSGLFLLNCVKAFGVFTTSGSAVSSFNNSYNCASISGSGTAYAITLNANAVTGNNVIVFVNNSASAAIGIGWSFSNPVLTLTGTGAFNNKFSFIILQA
tara:strand:- start:11592 stop:12161 length:570 start_codon:yes stop_codon:yes gene_type:complete